MQNKKKVDPLLIYSVYLILSSVANLYMINSALSGSIPSYYDYIVVEKIDTSLLLWNIGNSCLFIGYMLFEKTKLPSISVLLSDKKKLRIAYRVMLILSVSVLYMFLFPLGAIGSIISAFSILGIVFFARLWGMTGSREYKKYAITLFLLQTAVAFLYSFLRFEMLMPSICLLVGYFIGANSISKVLRSGILTPIALIVFIFIVYFDSFGNHRVEIGSGIDRFTRLEEINTHEEYDIYESREEQNIVYRSSILPQLTSVVELVDTKGEYGWTMFTPLVTALIPRFLWPEKPIIAMGGWFAYELGLSRQIEGRYTNSINMTIVGHLFLAYGWISVIIGCILFGGVLVLIWNGCAFYESPYNITGIILGGYILLISFSGMGADLQIAITFLAYYLIFLILKRLV